MQDLSVRMSTAGSCRTTCARSLHQDLSRTTCIRLFQIAQTQLYQHFKRWTRTISADGCTSKSEIAILPAFCALDTHDLRRGFTFRNHASEVRRLPRNHEPRSYEMLHWPRKSIPQLKFQKCSPSQELSPLTSKCRIHGADSLCLPRKTQSFE